MPVFEQEYEEGVAASIDRVRALQKLWSDSYSRRMIAREKIEFASGDQIRRVPGMPYETQAHTMSRAKFSPNVADLIISSLSYLYNKRPKRKSQTDEAWSEMVWDFGPGLDLSLDSADYYTRLTGITGLKPRPVTRGGRDGFIVEIVTSDRFVVLPDPMDPTQHLAVLIWVGESGYGIHRRQVFEFWDRERAARFETTSSADTFKIPVEDEFKEHNYGVTPFSVQRNSLPVCGYYSDGLGGLDFLQNCSSLTRLGSQYFWTAMLQRGQPVVKSQNKDIEIGLSPEVIVRLDASENEDFFIRQGGANLPGQNQAWITSLDVFGQTCGLPKGSFQITQSQLESGTSIQTKRFVMLEDRRKRERTAAWSEHELFGVMSSMSEGEYGVGLDPNVETTFAPGDSIHTSDEELSRLEFEWANELVDAVETIMTLHPELTEAEAEVRAQKARLEATERKTKNMERMNIATETDRPDGQPDGQPNGQFNGQPDKPTGGQPEP